MYFSLLLKSCHISLLRYFTVMHVLLYMVYHVPIFLQILTFILQHFESLIDNSDFTY